MALSVLPLHSVALPPILQCILFFCERTIMNVDCRQYRKDMELLALKLKLKHAIADPRERREIEKRILVLEEELGLD